MNFKFHLGKIAYCLQISLKKKGIRYSLTGWTNKCADGKYIIFLDVDFDKQMLAFDKFKLIEHKIQNLIKTYALSDFYILITTKGLHCVCLDKVDISDFIKIATASKICDEKFISVPLHYGNKQWTLRLSNKGNNKIFYYGRIKSIFNYFEKSKPHFEILKKMAEFSNKELETPSKLDNLNEIVISKYKSG